MKLREYIDSHGLRQDWFAEYKLMITPQYLQAIMKDKKPSKPLLALISSVTDGQVTEADWE